MDPPSRERPEPTPGTDCGTGNIPRHPIPRPTHPTEPSAQRPSIPTEGTAARTRWARRQTRAPS
eukprot:7378816-Prymnesium_polylepis.1